MTKKKTQRKAPALALQATDPYQATLRLIHEVHDRLANQYLRAVIQHMAIAKAAAHALKDVRSGARTSKH